MVLLYSYDYPPGIVYLLQAVPRLTASLVPVYILHSWIPNSIPNYAWTIAYFLAIPTTAIFRRTIRYFQEERDIKRLGARRVPQIHVSWPGGLDLMQKIAQSFATGYLGDFWDPISTKYNSTTVNFPLLWENNIMTIEPENVKLVLASDFENYHKGPIFKRVVKSVLGSGVFSSDDDMWKFHRRITRPFFVRDRITDFELFDKKADLVVTKLKERFAQGEAVDFQDAMGRFTLDSATEFLFGSCVHSLSAELPYAHNSPRFKGFVQRHSSDEFVAAFNEALDRIASRTHYADAWPFIELFKDKTEQPMRTIDAYIRPILNNALARKSAAVKSPVNTEGTEAQTLLDHLVNETDDHVILKDEILNIMIAGRDTTMATLTFAIHCLSKHPNVLAKLREEILSIVGPNSAPSSETIRECRYLRAVINETLRLYPPVPFNGRRSKRSTIFPAPDGGKPYYVPADTSINYSVWLIHRRKDLWGPDADDFDPDRFLDARCDKYFTKNPFIFLPFNAGPRICLGQQFAYNETSFMLVRLLQAFDTITPAPDAQPPASRPPPSWASAPGRQAKEKIWPKSHLTLYSLGGLWLKMGEVHSDNRL